MFGSNLNRTRYLRCGSDGFGLGFDPQQSVVNACEPVNITLGFSLRSIVFYTANGGLLIGTALCNRSGWQPEALEPQRRTGDSQRCSVRPLSNPEK